MRMIKSIVLLFAIAATMATVSANVRVNGKMAKDSKFKVADLPSVGAQVINTFFTVALDSLTSSSDGFDPIINPQTSFIQISSTGIPVDPSVFNSTTAFSNPSPTDMVQAEHFVELVNHNQVVSNIESAYWDILKAAAALPNTDTSTLQSYTDACNYLWTDGVNKTHKSPVFVQYGTLKTAYATALATFRLKQATLSASDWYINSPIYQAALSNAQQDFQAVAPQVESALDTIATTGASLSATVFADAQSLFRSTAIASVIRGEAFSVVDGNPSFHVVFAQPPDWATNAAEYTSISISASNFATSTSSSYTSWSTGGSSFFGFFSWGANGNTKTDLYTAEATDITLNLDYILVELDRPWLDDSLFGVSQWKIPGEAIGSVSNGRPNQSSGRLPSYTTHLVVVKNLNIVASWTQRDTSYISRHISGGGRLGFGCFSIAGGNYQSGSSQNTQTAQFANSVLSAPGAQIIGYVQKIVPNSPPLRG